MWLKGQSEWTLSERLARWTPHAHLAKGSGPSAPNPECGPPRKRRPAPSPLLQLIDFLGRGTLQEIRRKLGEHERALQTLWGIQEQIDDLWNDTVDTRTVLGRYKWIHNGGNDFQNTYVPRHHFPAEVRHELEALETLEAAWQPLLRRGEEARARVIDIEGETDDLRDRLMRLEVAGYLIQRMQQPRR